MGVVKGADFGFGGVAFVEGPNEKVICASTIVVLYSIVGYI